MGQPIEPVPHQTPFVLEDQRIGGEHVRSRTNKNTPHPTWVRWFQSLVDTLSRPSTNRVTATAPTVNVTLNATNQSTGVGTGTITPGKYGEVQIQARATFAISGAGFLYIYVYRTTGAIPAAGAAPNAGDVIVGQDAFGGPATTAGFNVIGTLGFTDTGLNAAQSYSYYFAFNGTNGLVGTLGNTSNIIVSEF